MLNAIPVVGWILSLLFSTSLAIPFFFLWNHLAPRYFTFMPEAYLNIPFADCIWIFMTAFILKAVFLPNFRNSTTNEIKVQKD
jgi:hypothetical protein